MNQLRKPLVVDRARLAGTHFVIEAVDALLKETDTPLAHRATCEVQVLGDCAVGLPSSRRQHDARTRHQRCRNRPRTRYRSQLRALLVTQYQFRLRSTHRHVGISRYVDTSMLLEHRLVNNGTEH